MLVILEADARRLVGMTDAIAAVEAAFTAMAAGAGRNYPVVREQLGYRDAVFGVKTGADVSVPYLGLKAGGYWPGNGARGLTNHQSTTLLFDPETGRPSALVGANHLTGLRTGAASAIATRHLARPDAAVLGLVGTGGQAAYQLEATLAVRPIREVHAWSPSPEGVARFGEVVRAAGLDYRPRRDPDEVAAAADVLVTVTPSRAPLVSADAVRPGTHVNAMGADTRGKQELAAELVARAAVFVDEAGQAVSIGECQHAVAAGLVSPETFRTIGDVVSGRREGRRSADEITLFDGTGVSLQDLAVAHLAVRLAGERGGGVRIGETPAAP